MVRKQSPGVLVGRSSCVSHRAIALILALLAGIAVGGCPRRPPIVKSAPPPTAKPAPERVVWRESKSGVGFRLSDADPERPTPPAAKTTRLAAEDAQSLLARLPPMARAPEVKAFALREKSLRAPRPGRTVKTAFPPVAKPPLPSLPVAAHQALRVERHAPEGEIRIAPELTVTFSEPMVELSSHGELAKLPSPVELRPQPPGRWRWIGTQTAVFTPDHERFPMATQYRVTVPEGTTSVAGKRLAAAEQWTFSTPPVVVENVYPTDQRVPQGLEPILFATFNQRIDRTSVLARTALRSRSAGSDAAAIPLRQATDEEIDADRQLRFLRQHAEPGRWLAFRATSPLPKATSFGVVFDAGLPSAEGPTTTESSQSFHFRTYSPLSMDGVTCSWTAECAPLAPWSIEFNNPLDAVAFDRELVQIEPPLAGLKLEVVGRHIVVRGRSKGRTKYQVTVLPGLRDTFGQSLESPATGEISVGAAEPVLFSEQDPMVVADPAFADRLAVFSVNRPALRVRLYQTTPEDWSKYLAFRDAWDYDQTLTTPPGRLVVSRTVQTRRAPDELVETTIELGPALKDGHGQVIAIVEPTTPPKRDRWGGIHREWVRCWVQATSIGLQAFWDQDTLYGWTSTLADGDPLAGVDLGLVGTSAKGATDASGIAKLALPSPSQLLVARKGSDLAFLTTRRSSRWGGDYFAALRVGSSERWFLFTDRGLYKPGERVHAKGWARVIEGGRGGDVEQLPAGADRDVRYVVRDPRGAELAKGSTMLDQTGGFHLAFDLPKNANLGLGTITLATTRSSTALIHELRIEEFRRPEFEVTAAVSEGPHLVGDHAIATVAAAYYAGGGLPSAPVKWSVAAHNATYRPPNFGTYHFGEAPRFFSWWLPKDRPEPEIWEARTGPDGAHRLRIDFDALPPHYPRSLDLEATVTDVNSQEWTARSSLLAHPASVTVGLRSAERIVRAGEELVFDVIVTDLDGKPVSGRAVGLKAARLDWDQVAGDYVFREADAARCEITSSIAPGRCTFPTQAGGEFLVSAVVADVHGRKSRSEVRVWVLSDDLPEGPRVPAGKVELVPDREAYRSGDEARLLVMAPFAPAEGVLTVRRDGIEEIRRVTVRETTSVLEVGLLGRYVPNVTVRLDLVGAEVREGEAGTPDPTLPKRPAFATGSAVLRVPPVDRSLAIAIEPASRTVKPGQKTRIDLDVKDATGQLVANAEVALVVVDESVLALTGYETPDPLEVFYPQRGEGTRDLELRFRIALMRPDTARHAVEAKQKAGADGDTAAFRGGRARGAPPLPMAAPKRASLKEAVASGSPATSAAPMEAEITESAVDKKGTAPGGGRDTTPLTVRLDWSALAAFVPSLRTNVRGHAAAKVKLPDNLTRYRVMAVAASGRNRFGSAEDAITARLPLMVRASPPRFLNFGDRFELPVVLQNQTNDPFVADVVARAANLELLGVPGLRVEVPANDRVEVRFPAAAARPGTARFQVGATTEVGTDASEQELPVWTPATTEAFATYGTVDEGAILQPVRQPRDAVKEWGGLELTTSSTALQGLTDAVLYLVKYPYECNEQISSRVITIAALRDVLDAFQAEGLPPKDTLLASVKEDLKRLADRQHWSGGWDWWRRDRNPVPYVSLNVAHAMVRAKGKGFPVPEETYRRALAFLRQLESWIPAEYPPPVRQVLIAYGLYVRNLAGDGDPERARRLIGEAGGLEQLPLEGVGFIWPVFTGRPGYEAELGEIRRLVNNRVTETAGNAHFATSYRDGGWLLLHSDRRVDGILLDAMIGDGPESSLIPKVVKGLLAHRKRGRWYNTQENAFVLLALDRYFARYERVTPDFVARIWLGDGFVAEHPFRGRSTDRQEVDVPMAYLAKLPQPSTLTLAKEGPGRLYYRLGMQYAPKDLWLTPVDHGFAVSRTYEGVEAARDVRRARDGVWHIKRGASVRVRVNLVARARRYHVALVDPIPAGCEPLNPALATTATIPNAPPEQATLPWWWSSAWYEHQNLRDERAEAFASLLWEGVYEYQYVVRATTPGSFVVPPPKAEEMYDPETFGRGASDRVIVE
ncbi:MAG: Ig-like domain-containing protein [Polyangiaceae bacterium]|nr:Ig-like domain-containing protein [Polyangiaceae bacterium]